MGRWSRSVPCAVLVVPLLMSVGCGGGMGNVESPPPSPPPPADFSLNVSATTISIPQGGVSAPLTISVTGENGFSGEVQVTLSGLPDGMISNPPSPFVVSAGGSTVVVLGAAANAATGNYVVTAKGASGAIAHSASLTLTVQSGHAQNLPRTAYVRTDAIKSLDDPPGEPHHRHITYDPGGNNVFVANRAMNRVEVFSAADQTRKIQINVPGAASADLSADGSTIWIGTTAEQVVAIDAATQRVKGRYPVSGISPLPNIVFDRPVEVLALANGKAMVRLRQAAASEALLALWDPGSNALTNLTSAAPQVFQAGVGAMARTGDHSKVLVAANDASGALVLFDANGAVLAGSQTLGSGSISFVAANPDGSRFALAFASNGNNLILLLDGALNHLGTYSTTNPSGLVFSRDATSLYVSENSGAARVVTVLDGHDLHAIGQVADVAIQGGSSGIEEAGETQLLFGMANRGVSFLDASNPGTLPQTAPVFAAAPVAQPSEGPSSGGTAIVLAGQNLESTAQAKFGTQMATQVSVIGTTQIQTVSPPSAVNGGVNVTAYFPSGWVTLAPDAFSYGPQVVEILPNASTKTGGESVQIYGYEFGGDASKVSVTIGGGIANVQKIEGVSTFAPSLGLDANYPFPLERITLLTPAGSPGKSDVVVTSGAGTATVAKAFQYLQDVQVFQKPGLYKFVLYDQKRQWVYLSNTAQVDVFDLTMQVFRGSIQPPGGPPPNAALRGLSLTPDGTQLVAADFGAQRVYLFNPDAGTGTSVDVGGVPGFLNSGPARVAATSAQTVFVGLSGEGGTSGACTNCLDQLNLLASPPIIEPAPQPQVSALTGAPLLQADGSGDHVFLAFGTAPGEPIAAWDASTPGQFTTSVANSSTTDLAASADGAMFATHANGATEIRGADLLLTGMAATSELERVPGRVNVPGVALHYAGALIYEPFLTGPAPAAPPANGIQGGVDISDARSGRLRLRVYLPEPFAMLNTDVDGLHGGFLAVDENGQRLFALTTSGLTVVQLSSVPLGIGTILPASGPAAGGSSLTIRGSGFQAGSKVTIGGKAANASFKDMNTLVVVAPALTAGPQQLVITNSDGESVILDAAFLAN